MDSTEFNLEKLDIVAQVVVTWYKTYLLIVKRVQLGQHSFFNFNFKRQFRSSSVESAWAVALITFQLKRNATAVNPLFFFFFWNNFDVAVKRISKLTQVHTIEIGCTHFCTSLEEMKYWNSRTSSDVMRHLQDANSHLATVLNSRKMCRECDYVAQMTAHDAEMRMTTNRSILSLFWKLCNQDVLKISYPHASKWKKNNKISPFRRQRYGKIVVQGNVILLETFLRNWYFQAVGNVFVFHGFITLPNGQPDVWNPYGKLWV